MKQVLVISLFFVSLLLVACQGQDKTSSTAKEQSPKEVLQEKPSAAPAKSIETNGKSIQTIVGNKITLEDGSTIELPKEDGTTIFLIRHAEKMDTGENPGLTEAGKARAESLINIFKSYDLNRVYTTFFQRTTKTIEPLTQMMGTFYNAYQPNDLEAFAKSVLEKDKGKKILIVGHSNTTPNLVNLLSGENNKYQQIPEEEYDHFYIVHIDPKGKVRVIQAKY